MNFILKRNFSLVKSTFNSLSDISLIGRDFICPLSLTPTELKSLLWTALDLKSSHDHHPIKIAGIDRAQITVISDNSSVQTHLPLRIAAKTLNASINVINDSEWKNNNVYVGEYGRLLALSSNLIFCQINQQHLIEEIANGADVPVLAISSSTFNLIKTLSDMMTVYLHFNRLKYLTLAWIGKPEALFNTYLYVLPQLKINLKYCLVDSDSFYTNETIDEARKYSQKYNTEMHEILDPNSAIRKADIIATSAHNNRDYQVTMDNIKEAALKWALLHELPRGQFDVQREVFNHENSLVWKSVENLQWIYSAIIIRFLTNYNHYTNEPKFDSIEFVPQLKKFNNE